MAKLARRLNESNVNVILTQSASMLNLTSALRTLQVDRSTHVSRSTVSFALGEEGSHRVRELRHVVARELLLRGSPDVRRGTPATVRLDSHGQRLRSLEFHREELHEAADRRCRSQSHHRR